MKLKEYLNYVCHWKDPKLSGKFIGLLLTIAYINYINVLVLIPALFFLRTVIVIGLNKLKSKIADGNLKVIGGLADQSLSILKCVSIPDEDCVKYWIQGVSEYVLERTIKAVTKMEEAETDSKMFKVVAIHFVGLFLLNWMFSVQTMIVWTGLAAMTVYPIYTKYKTKIDPLVTKTSEKLKPHVLKVSAHLSQVSQKLATKIKETSTKMGSTKVGESAVEGKKTQ